MNDIHSLWERLRTEKLLISTEISAIKELHQNNSKSIEGSLLQSWKRFHLSNVLKNLVGYHDVVSPETCCSVVRSLHDVKAVPAYRLLGHHYSSVQRILQRLFATPRVMADILGAVETNQALSAVDSVFSLIYANMTFASDERAVVEMLSELLKVQLIAQSSNCRLLLRKNVATFPRLYRLFSESLPSARVFLTAALHDSVMHVLCQDEIYLDLDPTKTPLRFPASERVRRFGPDPTNPTYHKKVEVYRRTIAERIIMLTHHFVKGINDALHATPSSLVYIVKQLYVSLVEEKSLSQSEATLICTDLLVTNLLCPAIAHPEHAGIIVDTPISRIARFNLMQIGQLIQTLCLSRLENPAPHILLYIGHFRENPICNLVQSIVLRATTTVDELFPSVLPDYYSRSRELYTRTQFLGSLSEINVLISLLKSTSVVNGISDSAARDELSGLVATIPTFRSPPQKTPLSQQSSHGSNRRHTAEQTEKDVLPRENFDVVVFDANEEESSPCGLQSESAFLNSENTIANKAKRRARFAENGVGSASACSDNSPDDPSDLEDESGDTVDVASMSSSLEAPQEEERLLDLDGVSTLPDNASDLGCPLSGRASPSLSGRGTPLSQAHSQGNREHDFPDDVGASSTVGNAALAVEQRNLPRVPVAIRKENAEGLDDQFGKFSVPTSGGQPKRDDQRSLLSESWSTNVVASDDEGSSSAAQPVGGSGSHHHHHHGNHRVTLNVNLDVGGYGGGGGGGVSGAGAGGGGGPQVPQAQPVSRNNFARTGSIGVSAEDRSDTWSLDAVASDSEADLNVRDAQPTSSSSALPVGRPPRPPPADYSAAEVASSSRATTAPGLLPENSSNGVSNTLTERNSPPLDPFEAVSNEARQQLSNAATSASVSVPIAVVGSGGEQEDLSSSPSNSSAFSKKKASLIQGLQKVGDRMKKGVSGTNQALRKLPHSSTLTDLLSSSRFGGSKGDVREEERGGTPVRTSDVDGSSSNSAVVGSMPTSKSENHLAGLSADDILAKYQRSSPNGELAQVMNVNDEMAVGTDASNDQQPPAKSHQEEVPYYNPTDLVHCRAFVDTKRKLRLVLSSSNLLPSPNKFELKSGGDFEREKLTQLLRILLSEAIGNRSASQSAHIREVCRCLQFFDANGIRKLLLSLNDDLLTRSEYATYVQQSHVLLIRLSAIIDNLHLRIEREITLIEECIVDVLVRVHLENSHALRSFYQDFANLSAQDERASLVSRTLEEAHRRIIASPTWRGADEAMIAFAKKTFERQLLGEVHDVAFYPNGDADRMRDEVMWKSLNNLAKSVTPEHPMLRIPRAYHGEAPWPSAQAEIAVINAYKSAKDKLKCVTRCCETITNLLSMASASGSCSADDITPVLVYVIIQANPLALLSNVQFVSSFGAACDGADGYWWTQFTAAIGLIKTLL